MEEKKKNGDSVALYYQVPAGGHVDYQELVVTVTVLNLQTAEIVFDKFPTGPLSGDVFADDKGIHLFDTLRQSFRVSRVRGYVEWSGSGNPEVELKLKRGRLKIKQFKELPLVRTTFSTAAKQRVEFDIGPEDRSTNRIWEIGSAGQCLALYYQIRGNDSALKFHGGRVAVTVQPIFTRGLVPSTRLSTTKVVALVVGISKYTHFNSLRHAANDAEAIAKKLEEAGATVILAKDCNILQLRKKKIYFMSLVNEGDIAFFFFAGHGCQFRNHQRCIARPLTRMERTELEQSPKLIKDYSINIDLLIEELIDKKTHLNLILLDCCRNFQYVDIKRAGDDPIVEGDKERFNLNVPKGTVIGHATAPGEEALDGSKSDGTKGKGYTKDLPSKGVPVSPPLAPTLSKGPSNAPAAAAAAAPATAATRADLASEAPASDPNAHGYYTKALLEFLTTPYIDIDLMLRKVGQRVVALSGGKQTPYRHSCINAIEDVYLFVKESGSQSS